MVSPNPASSALKRQALQKCSKLLRKLRPLEREFHRGLEHAEFVARVEALAFKRVAEDFFFLEQGLDPIRELNLAHRARLRVLKQREDTRGENVAADDGLRR